MAGFCFETQSSWQLEPLMAAIGLEAGGALDAVCVQGEPLESLWRVVRSAELPRRQQLDLLDLTSCRSLEQLARVVQARSSAVTVRFGRCGVVPADGGPPCAEDGWEPRQGLLAHPLFQAANRLSLRWDSQLGRWVHLWADRRHAARRRGLCWRPAEPAWC